MSEAKTRVFIAEDDDLILMVLTDIVEELGYSVVGTSRTVAQARDFISKHTCDLAVVDVRLRDGSVEPFADDLLRRNVPFALATGFASQDLVARYKGCPVLHKPYLTEDVRVALDKLRAMAASQTADA